MQTPAQIYNKMFKNGLMTRNTAYRSGVVPPSRTNKLKRKGQKHLFSMNAKGNVKDPDLDWHEISPVSRHGADRIASNPSEHSIKSLLKEESFHSDAKSSDKDGENDWRAGAGFGADMAANGDNQFQTYSEFGADYDGANNAAVGGKKRPKKKKMPSRFSNRLKAGGGKGGRNGG